MHLHSLNEKNPFTVKFQGHGRSSLINLQQQVKTDSNEDKILSGPSVRHRRFNLASATLMGPAEQIMVRAR